MDNAKNDIDFKKNEEDRNAVRKILNDGDHSYFTFLQNKYYKIIASLIRRMIKDEDDVEDLTQETFIKAYSALNTYRFEYAFSSWIYRIASNNCIDFLRKKRFPMISIDKPIDYSDDDLYFEIEDKTTIPDLNIMSEEKRKIIEDSINCLTENYREIIKLRHEEELEYTEIASKLNLPLGTVKAHLYRARKILMIKLKKHQYVLNDN